jgi:hypothetical protein
MQDTFRTVFYHLPCPRIIISPAANEDTKESIHQVAPSSLQLALSTAVSMETMFAVVSSANIATSNPSLSGAAADQISVLDFEKSEQRATFFLGTDDRDDGEAADINLELSSPPPTITLEVATAPASPVTDHGVFYIANTTKYLYIYIYILYF